MIKTKRVYELAPSDELRKFYHETRDFEAFKKKYTEELKKKDIKELLELAKQNTITLLYASKEPQNNAVVLKEYLDWTLEKQK